MVFLPEMYELVEDYDAHHIIWLKHNALLGKLSGKYWDEFYHLYGQNCDKYCAFYESFYDQAATIRLLAGVSLGAAGPSIWPSRRTRTI